MALNTSQPANLPTTNSLADIPADLLGPIPAEIKLGQSVLMVMEKPPAVRDVITVTMRLRVKDSGVKEAGEGGEELTHYRACKIVAAWLKGDPEPPDDADTDVPMINTDGSINEDVEDEPDVTSGVESPGFSDGAK